MNNPGSLEITENQRVLATNGEAGQAVGVLPKRAAQCDLPYEDDTVVSNFCEHPLSLLLTDSIMPWLQKRNPGERFIIGQDNYIYFRLQNPLEEKAKAPDWFCVENVSPTLDGDLRLSYVLWEELVVPTIVLEYISDNRREEWDRTPREGKFWAYEQAIQAPFYGIFDQHKASLEVYALAGGNYQQMTLNAMGRYLITPLGLELGIWHGKFFGVNLPWLRWWNADQGTMLPTGFEGAEIAKQQRLEAVQQRLEAEQLANEAKQLADEAKRQRLEAEKLADEAKQQRLEAKQQRLEAEQRLAAEKHLQQKLEEKLRSLGIDPDTI